MKKFLIPVLLLIASVSAISQDKKKPRLAVQYITITNGEASVNVSAKYKSENGFEPVTGADFHFYLKPSEDSLLHLGSATTNEAGKAKFIVNKALDSADLKTFVVKLENNASFSEVESELSVRRVLLIAKMETIDSVNQIAAVLTDAADQPLAGQALKVQLQRMYAPLTIGEESYTTDESGAIRVPVTDSMPGINGNLTFEVVLSESDEYGTVKSIVNAPIGTPITDQSTFDKRTMWSPPSKTPYYLLIFPNLIILGVWIPIFFLFINLYRISKSKTQ